MTPDFIRSYSQVLKDGASDLDGIEIGAAVVRIYVRTAKVLDDLANQVERLEAQRKELREALQYMLIEQEREGFCDEMPDIKNARAALKATE